MIFFGPSDWSLGALARRRSHRKMFRVVMFMSPPATEYKHVCTFTGRNCCDVWCGKSLYVTPRVEIWPGRKVEIRQRLPKAGTITMIFWNGPKTTTIKIYLFDLVWYCLVIRFSILLRFCKFASWCFAATQTWGLICRTWQTQDTFALPLMRLL